MKKYDLNEICQYLKKESHEVSNETKCNFTQQGLKCFYSTTRGMGGWTNRALLIPESIHIIVSPQACGRHGFFDSFSIGCQKRVYRYCLSEDDIVLGKGVECLQKEIVKLISHMDNKPKVVTICTTCVDALLHSDYSSIKRVLDKKYGIRFIEIKMFPFLAESMKSHKDMLWESVYSGIKCEKASKKEKRVNIIGSTSATDLESDFYRILSENGYQVQEIHHCKSIEEYDNMGRACLNVVVCPHSIAAAKMMEKKYGIPYIEFFECIDEDMIAGNYEKLGEVLGEQLDIEQYLSHAKEKVAELKELANNKNFAIGGNIDHNSVKAAYYFAKMGLTVKYFIVNQIKKADLEYYKWLKENTPETKVYLGADTSMFNFIYQPDEVDYTAGIEYGLIKNAEKTTMIKMSDEPYDFISFINAIENIKSSIDTRKEVEEQGTSFTERMWCTYREEI